MTFVQKGVQRSCVSVAKLTTGRQFLGLSDICSAERIYMQYLSDTFFMKLQQLIIIIIIIIIIRYAQGFGEET